MNDKTQPIRLSQREEWVSLLLHKYVVDKLLTDPSLVLEKAAGNLRNHIIQPAHGMMREWHTEWFNLILTSDTEKIIGICLGVSSHDADMRQVSPFIGVLTQSERASALREARTCWERYNSHSTPGQKPDWLATDKLD